MVEPLFFDKKEQWHDWLERNHAVQKEVWLSFWKKGTDKTRLLLDEAVEEALCYGWIDSTLRRMDDQKYMLRFTPRRKDSRWSSSNLERVRKLKRQGRMKPAGIAMLPFTDDALDPRRYPREVEEAILPPELEVALAADPAAHSNFLSLPKSHQKAFIFWIVEAKRPETRKRRVMKAIEKLSGPKVQQAPYALGPRSGI